MTRWEWGWWWWMFYQPKGYPFGVTLARMIGRSLSSCVQRQIASQEKQGRFQAQGHGCLPALLRFCHKFLWCCDAGVRGTVKESTIKIQGCSEWTELPKGKRFLACELPYETSRDRWKHGTGLDLACAIHTLTTDPAIVSQEGQHKMIDDMTSKRKQ